MKPTAIESARTERQVEMLADAVAECGGGGVHRIIIILRSRDGIVTYADGGDSIEALGLLQAAMMHLHNDCAAESHTEPVA